MIQFNLLPDVKQEFMKARRTQRTMLAVSVGVSALAIFILLVMMVTVDVVQKKSLHDLNNDITTSSQKLEGTADLNKILTIQNQLHTLTGLHDKKVVTSRLFTYISQVTPSQASISKLQVDYTQNTMSITGEAPTLDIVKAFTDTLKNTHYQTDTANSSSKLAFSQVVLSAFGRDSRGATYTITLSFDPTIFDGTISISGDKLSVPSGTAGAQPQLFQQEAL